MPHLPYLLIIFTISLIAIFYFLRHILGGAFGLYRVVPVNEAHIRIQRNKKQVFSARTKVSSYWYIPFITKLHKLPLCNLAIPVNDIKLNDKDMAKFVCDIMCFINIENIELAVERLILTDASKELGFDLTRLSEDLRAIMESIGRTVATKQGILDIYMDRSTLDVTITKEVETVFPKWGIKLVDLELKDIKDAPDSTIIDDIERKVAAQIHRDAEIKVAITTKEAEIAKAENEELYRKRHIEKDQAIGIANQKKDIEIAREEAKANEQEIAALRVTEVGKAEIDKQRIEQQSQAEKIKFEVVATGKAKEITLVGQAEADMIKAKIVAEADGTLKLAAALKEYNDVGFNITLLETQERVQIAKFKALSEAMSKADIRWIMSGDDASRFFGINLDAGAGANISQFMEESGITVDKIKEALATLEKTKTKVQEKVDQMTEHKEKAHEPKHDKGHHRS